MSNNVVRNDARTLGAMDEADFWKLMGQNLTKRRLELRLKQDWVSSRAKISRTSYVKLEKGQRKISSWELKILSYILCLPIDEFLPKIVKWDEQPPESK